MIYVDQISFTCLQEMETNLRSLIQSRAVPDEMLPGLRATLRTLQVTLVGAKPDPVSQTWVDGGGDAA